MYFKERLLKIFTSINMLLIGHRGVHGIAQENTLEAFQKALDLRFDMVEMDLRIWDNEIVVTHDPIEDTKDPNIPTLKQVLDLLNGRVKVYLDIKESVVLLHLCPLLSEYFKKGVWNPNDVYIASFNHYDLLTVRSLLPDVHRGALLCSTPVGTAQVMKAAAATFVGLDVRSITKVMVEDCHAADIEVFVYTISSLKHLQHCEKLGITVDGLVLDYPLEQLS